MYPLVLEYMHVIVTIYIISHNVRILTFTSRVDMERSPQKQVYIQDYYRALILLVISTTHIQIPRHGLSPIHDVYSLC